MTDKMLLYLEGLLSGCCVGGWILATVGIVHGTAVVSSGWEVLWRLLAFGVAAVAIIVLAMVAAAAVYLIGLRGPPDHMIGEES